MTATFLYSILECPTVLNSRENEVYVWYKGHLINQQKDNKGKSIYNSLISN